MSPRRSTEETEMRALVETWGRARWPAARCVHELVISECRIDMAFIGESHIAGVEIKSSRDVLDRLDKQVGVFREHLPEFWLAIAPQWIDGTRHEFRYYHDTIVVDVGAIAPVGKVQERWGGRGEIQRAVTVQMLDILWSDELRALCRHHRLDIGKKPDMKSMIAKAARLLTGDEIVAGVCRELRARGEGRMGQAFVKADPAIPPPPIAEIAPLSVSV